MGQDFALLIRAATHEGGGLGADDACELFAAMLAGAVGPHALSETFAVWRNRRTSLAETMGFMRALNAHAARLERPSEGPRPVILPACHGTRRQANLTALVALLLQRYEIPVLVHDVGSANAASANAVADTVADAPREHPITTADVLWELGIEPAVNIADAQARLRHDRIAYVPSVLLAPGLARLRASIAQDSWPTFAHAIGRLVDPFGGDGYRVIGAASAADLAALREFLPASGADALLFEGTEGEPFADPRRQARFEHLAAGVVTPCAEADAEVIGREFSLPVASDAVTTAAWIASVLAGTEPVPPSILAQLGCCLAGARRRRGTN